MNYEPLIKGISELIGATGRIAEEGRPAVKGERKIPRTEPGHTPVDVERWLGNLSTPDKQLPLIHDYLRGKHALEEARTTGATHVRDISVPVWENSQAYLQKKLDLDPEAQAALRTMFEGRMTPRDPSVRSVQMKPTSEGTPVQSVEMPEGTPTVPQAKTPTQKPSLDAVARKNQADAWNEFAIATESQDAHRIEAALERIAALHDGENLNLKPGETAPWKKALDYMGALEEQVQQWRMAKLTNEQWSSALHQFREQAKIEDVPLPKAARTTIQRFEAWADAQKPATMEDLASQALGVPRAVMSSADLSAPGRQGLLMISRPEYWDNLKPMVEAWDEGAYLESQAYIRNHPDFDAAQEAGLAIADLHAKLGPREEAFQSNLAERIPVLGNIVKSSEQAYTTFLNRLRFDVFSNSLKEAAASGIDVSNPEFLKSLGEWINTSTGRGGRNFNPGVLSTVLFSPRLAVSRFQTFNPWYYYKMNPFVRRQALKANIAAAAFVYGLVSAAALGGAKVTWDFRNSDAGKIRIGDTRLDLGGGHFQFLRLFTQLATQQKVNSETGKVTKLGEKFGSPNGLDLVTNFIIAKEAPVASFVTDWLRGKDMAGEPFKLDDAVISRTVPLAMQDMYDVLKDQGVMGLLYAFPAVVGVGVQTYHTKPSKEVVPFAGVNGIVPPEQAAAYAKQIEEADKRAAVLANAKTKGKGPATAKAVLRNYVKAERMKVRREWIMANRDAYIEAKKKGEPTVPLVAPGGSPQ